MAKCFNPRARARGDLMVSSMPSVTVPFQPTPPREGRLLVDEPDWIITYSFNPRPRARGDSIGA